MINHLRKIAIVEDASPDNVVVLSNVTEGVDGAATFGYSMSEQTVTAENGQTIMDMMDHELDIRTLVGSSSEETDLDSFVSSETEVYVAGLLIDGFLHFGDKQTTSELARIGKANKYSDRKSHGIMITKRGTPGFDPSTGIHSGGVKAGANGLGLYVWGDADSSGVADGWSATGFTTSTFATGTQTLEADTTQRDFERAIYFPFESEQITFAINNDSRTGTYTTEQIELEFVDSSDSVISSQTTTFSSTGRKIVTGTTPANTVQVVCRLSLKATSGTVTNEVSDPSLRIGTETTYTKY